MAQNGFVQIDSPSDKEVESWMRVGYIVHTILIKDGATMIYMVKEEE